jgi:hypothetical protein
LIGERSPDPVLLKIRLDECWRRHACNAQFAAEQGVTQIPGVTLKGPQRWCNDEPPILPDSRQIPAAPNTLEERLHP